MGRPKKSAERKQVGRKIYAVDIGDGLYSYYVGKANVAAIKIVVGRLEVTYENGDSTIYVGMPFMAWSRPCAPTESPVLVPPPAAVAEKSTRKCLNCRGENVRHYTDSIAGEDMYICLACKHTWPGYPTDYLPTPELGPKELKAEAVHA